MSVINYSPEEIGAFCAWSLRDMESRCKFARSLLDEVVLHDMINLSPEKNEVVMKSQIESFWNRIFLANQVAYILQYADMKGVSREIQFLEDKHVINDSKYYKLENVYKDLRQLDYNLHTNAGRTFLSGDDMEKLRNLIARIALEIIEPTGG
jgi:hypothetical protein